MDSFGRFIAIVATVVLVLILPLGEIAKGQAETMQGRADMLTEEFADIARHQGYVTTEMYEDYLSELGKLGDTYNISLQVAHPVTGKESAKRNLGTSKMQAEYTSYKGGAEFQTKLLATHTHTDECYSGHRHTAQPNTFTHYHKHINYAYEDGYTASVCQEYLSRTDSWGTCISCGTLINYMTIVWYWSPTGGQTFSWSHSATTCSNCGRSLNVTNTYQKQAWSYSCGYSKDLDGDGYTDKMNRSTSYPFPGQSSPQVPGNGLAYTYTAGCWSYHQHGYMNSTMYGTRWAWTPITIISNMQAKGASAYCTLPETIILYYRKNGYANTYNFNFQSARINNQLMYSFSIALPDSYLSVNSTNGTLTKMYLTPDEMVAFCYSNFFKQIYEWTIDKNSDVAKACLKASGAYTSWVGYPLLEEGKPVIGYSWQYSMGSGSSSYEATAYGQASNCNYATGWGYTCNQAEDVTLDCGNVVMSLVASYPTQTVLKGDTIITTAIATMLDGTTKTVNCTASNYDSNYIGTQVVTLTYYGLVNNAKTNGSKSCTTTVTVKSRKTLTGITVTPTSQEIKKYTDPTFAVTAFYSDGTSNQVMGFTTSGFDNTKIGEQTVTISYTEEGVNKTTIAHVTVKRLTTMCPVCGTVYELDDSDIDQGCPNCSGTIVGIRVSPEEVTVSKGENLPVLVTGIYRDGRTGILSGWTSDYDSNQLGLQNVKIMYETFSAIVVVTVSDNRTCPICGNVYSMNPDGSDPGCPICAEEVVSIEASPKDLTIERGGTLPITVVATYKDGHTSVVDGWGTDFMADKTGEYEVPIYYQTAVDYIYVTVVDEGMITCPFCHTKYSYSENPGGCPICSKQIVGIEAQLRYGGNQVLYRSELSLQIVLIYRDTHRKITYTGFEYSGFDSSILGIQTVTVTYGEFTTSITVEVIDNPYLVTCPLCGSEYYLNEDGSDPGCPYCNGDPGENAVFYFDCTYTMSILDTLYNNGIYYLTEGDYFTVTVTTIRDSIISKLANLFRSRKLEDFKKENSSFGGEVSL